MALSSAAELPSPREPGAPYRVCLVCLGNICRSPMAETVLRAELAAAGLDGAVVVDSAGTGDWHVGDAMDPGARAALASRGFDGSDPPGPAVPAVLAGPARPDPRHGRAQPRGPAADGPEPE